MNLKPNRIDPKFGVNKNWPTKLWFRKFDNNIHHEKCSIKIFSNFKSIENSGSHQDSINIISQSWNQFFMFCFSCIRNVWSLHMLMCENQIDSLLHQFLQSYIINWNNLNDNEFWSTTKFETYLHHLIFHLLRL